MKISESFPSKYMKSTEIGDEDLVVTIKDIEIKNVGNADDPDEKPVIYFEGHEKGVVLNKTNANTISSLYGDDTDGWIGKKIALFTTEVEYQGKMTLGIRVRLKAPKAGGNGAAKPAAAAPGWTLTDATIQAGLAGISREEMLSKLKAAGFAKWDKNCPAMVQAMIAAKKDNGGNSFTDDEGAPIADDDIPF